MSWDKIINNKTTEFQTNKQNKFNYKLQFFSQNIGQKDLENQFNFLKHGSVQKNVEEKSGFNGREIL